MELPPKPVQLTAPVERGRPGAVYQEGHLEEEVRALDERPLAACHRGVN